MQPLKILIAILLSSSLLLATDEIPEGFVMQDMEPSGGKILRPKDWFYVEGHRANVWMWTISKEDTKNGEIGYDTGVRIQAMLDVEKKTGKSPKVFIEEFFEQKKKSAAKVHKVIEPIDQGIMTRIGIEVTQGDHRIMYSLFWGNEIDLVVISIAGTEVANWDKHSETFNTMSVFELIDLERFSEADPENKNGEQTTEVD